jgi:Zn-dependent protease
MRPPLLIGRVAGIRIDLSWSLLIVFALIVWSLAEGVFPVTNPSLSTADHVAMAIAATMLFIASIVLHEFGHALRARREGAVIDRITLWLFGGVAQLRVLLPSPGAEFRIALAGPAVSIALAASFLAVANLVNGPEQVEGVCAWLGFMNLALVIFNLLPALPLDGGRVLRSALWRMRSDFVWATEVSAAISQGIASLLIAGGVFQFVVMDPFSGAWLAFVGWYLFVGATAERSLAERPGAQTRPR